MDDCAAYHRYTEPSCFIMTGRIITIPLAVILRHENREIKQTNALFRILPNANGSMRLISACPEGVFETVLSPQEQRQGKDKDDLPETEWLEMINVLFNQAVSGEHRAILWGKLISLEQYNSETGRLTSDELAEETPEFELSIRTADTLAITYGLFQFQFVDLDGVDETEDYDMLNWVALQAQETERLNGRLKQLENELAECKSVIHIKEAEIVEMTADYNAIIEDMEDRFFQAMDSKKRKIAELSGKPDCPLAELNLVYREKNALNLNRVKMDEIILGDAYKKYVAAFSTPKRSKPRASVKPKEEPQRSLLSLEDKEERYDSDDYQKNDEPFDPQDSQSENSNGALLANKGKDNSDQDEYHQDSDVGPEEYLKMDRSGDRDIGHAHREMDDDHLKELNDGDLTNRRKRKNHESCDQESLDTVMADSEANEAADAEPGEGQSSTIALQEGTQIVQVEDDTDYGSEEPEKSDEPDTDYGSD